SLVRWHLCRNWIKIGSSGSTTLPFLSFDSSWMTSSCAGVHSVWSGRMASAALSFSLMVLLSGKDRRDGDDRAVPADRGQRLAGQQPPGLFGPGDVVADRLGDELAACFGHGLDGVGLAPGPGVAAGGDGDVVSPPAGRLPHG